MASENGKHETEPVINSATLSWRESRRASALSMMMSKVGELPYDRIGEEMEARVMEIQGFMAKYVTSVPRSWLVDDAPETLDWSEPESFDWLRQDKFFALLEQITSTAAATKN